MSLPYALVANLMYLVRALVLLGQVDNSKTLERRVRDGSVASWLRSEHGEHVWAEISGGLDTARAVAPTFLQKRVKFATEAFHAAELELATYLPPPARIPTSNLISITERLETQARELERPTLRLIPGGASPSSPPRAA